MANGKAFRYSLEALIKKRNWDLDVQRMEEARARQILEQRNDEQQQLEDYIAELERGIREAGARDVQLNPDRYNAMTAFLNDQRARLEEKKKQAAQARRIHDQIIDQIQSVRKSIKSLEKHKERKKKDFEMVANRSELIENDDMWLVHKNRVDS